MDGVLWTYFYPHFNKCFICFYLCFWDMCCERRNVLSALQPPFPGHRPWSVFTSDSVFAAKKKSAVSTATLLWSQILLLWGMPSWKASLETIFFLTI